MKNLNFIYLLFAVTLLIGCKQNKAVSQDFEGVIVYRQTFESKTDEITDSVLTVYMGDTHKYFISTSNYKSVSNGNPTTELIYDKNNNVIHVLSNGESSLVDAGTNENELIDYKINENVENVLGFPCNELVLRTSNSILKYYYNPKIKFESNLYKNHKYGFWNKIVELTKSIPLKYVMEFEEFTVTGEATSIKNMRLDPDIFKLKR